MFAHSDHKLLGGGSQLESGDKKLDSVNCGVDQNIKKKFI